tara:strand:- start:48 stop:350 length:303 start_codon:yes stop_codon:yes gene_type:complete
MDEYEIYMKHLWDRVELLMKYENKKLTYELFYEIISDTDFDMDSVNVSISIYRDYEKMYGRKMYDDLRRKYQQFLNGDYDKEKKELHRKYKQINKGMKND